MNTKYAPLGQYAKKIECGPFGSSLPDTEYLHDGVLVVRPFNLVNCSIEKDRLVYISPETIRVKRLSKSYAATGRLDAEYYQPNYGQYAGALNTRDTVSSLCGIHNENFEPLPQESYPYIELANVGKTGALHGVETVPGGELPTRARRKGKAGQVIVSSIEGPLQSCALIRRNMTAPCVPPAFTF